MAIFNIAHTKTLLILHSRVSDFHKDLGTITRVLEKLRGGEQRRYGRNGEEVETKKGSGWGRPARQLVRSYMFLKNRRAEMS